MAADDEPHLANSIKALPSAVQEALEAHRFDEGWLLAQAALSRSGKRSNTVLGKVEALPEQDIVNLPDKASPQWKEFRERGEEALAEGRCALTVLAGGMATRMGGVIKALVPAVDGQSFLDLRRAEQTHLKKRYGKAPPLWLMTSYATHEGIQRVLGEHLQAPSLALFRQNLALRLDEDGEIFRTQNGQPSLYAPGHGDFPDCLRDSGLLEDFVKAGGSYIMATNLDNLGGGLDPLLIGMHLASDCAVTCEVVDKEGADRGGIPARLDGRPVILEEFRLTQDFDPSSVSVFNVNTFSFDAGALLGLQMDWSYFEVRKKVEERIAIQYERLINEVSFHLPTQYLRVPRHGENSRFLPIKDHDELDRRTPTLKALAIARGMIGSQ